MPIKSNRMVRWFVILMLGLATVGMIAVSLRANYLFGYGFGQTPEKAQIFGWANVAADIWKVFGLIIIGGLWREKQRHIALSLAPIWLLCLLWGLVGAVGVYAQDRTALVGNREAMTAAFKDAERELAETERRFNDLRANRSEAEVGAAMTRVLARPVLVNGSIRGTVDKLSTNCVKPDRLTIDACQEVAALGEELALAKQAAMLEARRDRARQRVTKLRDGGGSLTPDPVAELFAWLSHGKLSVREIGFGFPIVFALLIEIVSAFGLAGLVAYADATAQKICSRTESDAVRRGELLPAAASLSEQSLVVTWMAERTEPTTSPSATSVEELRLDYEAWCVETGVSVAHVDTFGAEFDRVREFPEISGKITKFGDRYYGIRLVDRKMPRLEKRNA